MQGVPKNMGLGRRLWNLTEILGRMKGHLIKTNMSKINVMLLTFY